jgi:hypothetical protein
VDKEDFYVLLDKYLNGNASPEEQKQLWNFYNSFQEKYQDLHSELGNMQDIEDKMLSRLNRSLLNRNKTVIKFFSLKRIAVAATALVVLSFSIYFYINKGLGISHACNLLTKNNDADPANDKAILTLSDGSKIALDDAEHGLLARQGNSIITKPSDGQIIYKAKFNSRDNKMPMSRYSVINTVTTPRGGKYRVVLPDGSKVWLNSASSLRYPTNFSGKERWVKLAGEAYFEITSDKSRPFRVLSNSQIVEVLGTHFNVNSYEDETYVKTTLLEGSVRVTQIPVKGKYKDTKLLKPGEQSVVNRNKSGITVGNVDAEKSMIWKNGYFQFQNTKIQDVMKEISRWYDVEIIYTDSIPSDEFTGFISRKVKLSAVLKILEQGGGLKFSIQKKKIRIKATEENLTLN